MTERQVEGQTSTKGHLEGQKINYRHIEELASEKEKQNKKQARRKNKRIDRQTDRQTDKHSDKQISKQTDEQIKFSKPLKVNDKISFFSFFNNTKRKEDTLKSFTLTD